MRKLILCILLFASIFCKAQLMPLNKQQYLDSLNAIVQSKQPDSVKALAYFDLGRYWSKQQDTIKANVFFMQGKEVIKKSTYLHAMYLFSIGMKYFYMRDKPAAKKYLLHADDVFANIKDKNYYLDRTKLWSNYSVLLSTENNHTQAIDILLNKVIPFANLSGNRAMLGTIYGNVATVLSSIGQNSKAAIYYKKSIAVLENTKIDTIILAKMYNNLARNRVLLGYTDEGKKMLDKANLLLKNHQNTSSYIYYCSFESYYFLNLKKYDEALSSLNRGILIAEKLNLVREKNDLLIQKYNILNEQKKTPLAKNVIIEIIKNDKNTSIENKILHYKQAAESFEKLNDTAAAYKFLKEYSTLNDSANQTKLKIEVNKLEIRYNAVKNQEKITKLEAEGLENQLKNKNHRLLTWLLSSICLLLAIFSITLFVNYKNRKKITAQREEILQQKVVETEQQKQLEISKALLQGGEEERCRVARDLHDGLGGMLASIKFNISSGTYDNLNNKAINKVINQLDDSIAEVRRMSKSMMPESLYKFGLAEAINDLCHSLMKPGFVIKYQKFGISESLSETVQINIYRIVQEILSNIIKHAHASNVLLQCSQNESAFLITVEDDGVGFNLKNSDNFNGSGLKNIKNRVGFLKGNLEISSDLNQGTTINIILNVEE